jgi:hypothetical protein
MNQFTNEMCEVLKEIVELGLIDVTTERQEKNGTRMYSDTITKVYYATYDSGYVRRLSLRSGIPNDFGMYPLNPRKNVEFTIPSVPDKVFTNKGYEKIDDPLERLKLIVRGVNNYREYFKKLREYFKKLGYTE